jgi:hypothetical protein
VRRCGERLAAREQLGVGAAEHLVQAQAVALEEAVVDEAVAAVAVLHAHQRRAVRGERAQPLFALAQPRLHRAPLADVARGLGESHQLAGVVADRVDHRQGPEPAAVLAQPPALAFEAAVAPRAGERRLRHAARTVLGDVELREMPADDLVGAVALDALGAGVPARHAPGAVQQVNGVVGDARDQQAELLVRRGGGRGGGVHEAQISSHERE